MIRVLFVDDEQAVLLSLQNLFRKRRREWVTTFVLGGEAALEALAANPFDVIVTDMRMPGMDGAALLAQVKERYPGVERIILSGHAESEMVVRAVPFAHQYLSKPCDADTLRVVIERACELQQLLADPAIKRMAGSIDKLPTLPQTYWDLTAAIADPDSDAASIAKIVEQDPAMSAKVLQLSNSAYFGATQCLTSVRQAITYLGINLLQVLAVTAHIFSAAESANPIRGFSLEALQSHSFLVGRIAARLLSDKKRAQEAFTAGVVHDVGKLVLAIGAPVEFAAVVQAVEESGSPFHVVEKARLGTTHAEVGAYLLGIWGLPRTIVEAVAFHHTPGAVVPPAMDVLVAVHIAAALVHEDPDHPEPVAKSGRLDVAFLERLGVMDKLPEWRGIVEEETIAIA